MKKELELMFGKQIGGKIYRRWYNTGLRRKDFYACAHSINGGQLIITTFDMLIEYHY